MPLFKYCQSVVFDTRDELVPWGITHMDRISMKKFKFAGTTDVFMQCKIRACATRPCGVCDGTATARRMEGADGRKLSSALLNEEEESDGMTHREGLAFTPIAAWKIDPADRNAMVLQTNQKVREHTAQSLFWIIPHTLHDPMTSVGSAIVCIGTCEVYPKP